MIFSLMAIASTAIGQTAEDGKPAEPIQVFAEAVSTVELYDRSLYSGFVESEDFRTYFSEVSGVIDQLPVRLGDKVRAGQLLAAIRPIGSGFDYQLHRVHSKNSGIVSELPFTAGSRLQAGELLAKISSEKRLKSKIYLTQDDYKALYEKSTKLAGFLAGSDTKESTMVEVKVELAHASKVADLATGTYPVEVNVSCDKTAEKNHVEQEPTLPAAAATLQQPGSPDCKTLLTLGSLVKVVLKKNYREGIRVPLKWLHSARSKVLLISPEKTAKWTEVVIGQFYGDEVEILNGIASGDTIATGLAKRPNEGDVVEIIAKEEPGQLSKKDGPDAKKAKG